MAQQHHINPHYLAEQFGPNELRLKETLAAEFLSKRVVTRAYLVHADLRDGSGHNVILGLAAPRGDRAEILQQVERAFGSIFDRHQHLDILFLDDDPSHEPLLRRKCPPFFERARNIMVRLS